MSRKRCAAVRCGIFCLAASACVSVAWSQVAVMDGSGQITAFDIQGETLDIQVAYRIPQKGWGRSSGTKDLKRARVTKSNQQTSITGRVEVAPGEYYTVQQITDNRDDAVNLTLTFTANTNVDTEGVYFWIDIPIGQFAGGACQLSRGQETAGTAVFPPQQPAQRHFLRAEADAIKLASPTQDVQLEVSFDRPVTVTAQDTREWKGADYSLFCQLAPPLKLNDTTSIAVTIKPSMRIDHTPANLTLDANTTRYRLDGFGGNYCFNIESPVTQYTLKNLQIAWARTEMTPYEWEPENDNDLPDKTDWNVLKSHDRPDSNLRREFLLAKQIQDAGIPYVISIWGLPRWLYENPPERVRQSKQRIHPEKWDELLECLGSYLLYAKRTYGVEPDLFSFNEANIGVDVLLTADEHRQAIQRIGAHFAKLGLKTKMLLADATGPRGTHTYALPAANDPAALQYCGAIGFHSWGGATPEQYAAWGDLAQRLNLPLLVAELGVDAGAWRTRAFDSYYYALREVRMYQELLLYARPQGTMQWEFTSDYGIAKVRENDGQEEVIPTARFHFVRHFCNLTPPGADALATSSDHNKVLFTAFRGLVNGQTQHTFHIANLGPARKATITGFPSSIQRLRAVLTAKEAHFQELPEVHLDNGTATLDLATQSLLTLTTCN